MRRSFTTLFFVAATIACQREPAADWAAPSRVPDAKLAAPQTHATQVAEAPHHGDLVALVRHRAQKSETVANSNGRSAIAYGRAASAYMGLARLTGDYDDYAKADELTSAAFQMPNALPPYLLRGRLHYSLHRLPQAEADLAAYIALPKMSDKERAAEQLLLADLDFQRGRYAQAEAGYEAAVATRQTSAALASLAYYRWRTGEFEAAESLYRKALAKLDAEGGEFAAWMHLQLGLMDLERGRYGDALGHYSDGEEQLRGYWLVEEHIAEVLNLQGRSGEAKQMYGELIERTGNPEFMDAMAAILRDEGNRAGARAHAARAGAVYEQRMERFAEATYGHALEHELEFGEATAAVELAERNQALRPNAEAEILLARAYLGVGRTADAQRAIEAALASPVRMAELHATAAAVYTAAGDVASAEVQAANAAALNPRSKQ